MRRITMWILGTVCGLVLLFSYATSLGSARNDRGSQHSKEDTSASTPEAGPQASAGVSASGSAKTSGTSYDGDVVETRFGDVQVRAVIAGGKLVDVIAVKTPGGDRRNVQINSRAVPILRKAALAAQSANIDSVSGATYTSKAYSRSLQAALDDAHFKA